MWSSTLQRRHRRSPSRKCYALRVLSARKRLSHARTPRSFQPSRVTWNERRSIKNTRTAAAAIRGEYAPPNNPLPTRREIRRGRATGGHVCLYRRVTGTIRTRDLRRVVLSSRDARPPSSASARGRVKNVLVIFSRRSPLDEKTYWIFIFFFFLLKRRPRERSQPH